MIKQGHLYHDDHFGRLIALESVDDGMVKVLIRLDTDYPRVDITDAEYLQPAPMRYYHGETPQ